MDSLEVVPDDHPYWVELGLADPAPAPADQDPTRLGEEPLPPLEAGEGDDPPCPVLGGKCPCPANCGQLRNSWDGLQGLLSRLPTGAAEQYVCQTFRHEMELSVYNNMVVHGFLTWTEKCPAHREAVLSRLKCPGKITYSRRPEAT